MILDPLGPSLEPVVVLGFDGELIVVEEDILEIAALLRDFHHLLGGRRRRRRRLGRGRHRGGNRRRGRSRRRRGRVDDELRARRLPALVVAHDEGVGHVRALCHARVGRAERLRVGQDHPALAAVDRHFIRLRREVAEVAADGCHANFDGRAQGKVRAIGWRRDPESAARRARARRHEKRGEERDARARAPRDRFRKGN